MQPMSAAAPGQHQTSTYALAFGALGVVFGDIGTSPLYTLRECLRESSGDAPPSTETVLGILSLIFWSLTMVVTVKYLGFVMKAHNHGEGGIFALLALVPESPQTKRRLTAVAVLVVIGAALLYGDGAITPAISVLSAMEGLTLASPSLSPLVIPLTCAILLGLFAVQRHGTEAVGAFFGPVMVVWFVTIAVLGIVHIARRPEVLGALSPHHAVTYFLEHGKHGFLVLGAVVLAVTGGEALYADMGHFGARPIRLAWLLAVMPSLLLCYFGQGALVLADPAARASPFYAMVPTGWPTILLVILSSAATVIASQALISGVFSLTRQAMQLGYFPRVAVRHTAAHTEGQIYIPQINWILAVGCLCLVLGFQKSERLASAYGIAVTGTMLLTSIVYTVVARRTWGWPWPAAIGVLLLFACFDVPFFLANTAKIADGGWVPVLIGVGFVTAMLVWSRGRALMLEEYTRRSAAPEQALPQVVAGLVARVPGTAVFMSSARDHVPPTLLHVAERLRALPEQVLIFTVVTVPTPTVPEQSRLETAPLGDGFHRVVAKQGFMERSDVPALVERASAMAGLAHDRAKTTYYLGRETLLAEATGRMGVLTEGLFAFLQKNAVTADRDFGIPPAQVIEIGIQLDL